MSASTMTETDYNPLACENEITCPLTGEIISKDDVDALIDLFERIKKLDSEIYSAKVQCIRAIAAKTDGDKKTRRVRGSKKIAVVEMPSSSFENSILKEVWNSYPKYRDEYLRLATIEVKRTEVNKMRNMAGEADFENFKKMVLAAEREPTANPSIKIEAIKS